MSDSIGSITSSLLPSARSGSSAPNPGASGSGDAGDTRRQAFEGGTGFEASRDFSSGAEVSGRPKTDESTEVEQVVESMNAYLQASKRSLEFSVDDVSGRTVITVMDAEQQEVIRQIPPEAVVALIQHFREQQGLAGMGIEEKA